MSQILKVVKENDAGTLVEIDIGGYITYNIHTKKGCYRGGNTYSKEKQGYLVSGSCEMQLHQDGRDSIFYLKAGDHFTIPAHIPNLFYFPQESVMIESFPVQSTKEKRQPYQDIKNKNR